MFKPKKHIEEIRNLAFSNEILKIKKNDVVEYLVAKHNQSTYNSLYQEVKRFFILYIEEADVESPSLYQSQNFNYRFREPGTYNVYCLNYPKMKQTVIVEDKESMASVTDIRCSEVMSQISVNAKDSLFRQSDDQHLSYYDLSIDQEFNDISECLHLINEGCPAFSIKNKFTDLFENENKMRSKDLSYSIDEIVEKEYHNYKPNCKDQPISNSHIRQENNEDLFKVHQLNKLSPNNLFVLLTKLKQQYVNEDINKEALQFKTFDDLAIYCKNTYKRPEPKSNFNNKAVINRALANISRRFN